MNNKTIETGWQNNDSNPIQADTESASISISLESFKKMLRKAIESANIAPESFYFDSSIEEVQDIFSMVCSWDTDNRIRKILVLSDIIEPEDSENTQEFQEEALYKKFGELIFTTKQKLVWDLMVQWFKPMEIASKWNNMPQPKLKISLTLNENQELPVSNEEILDLLKSADWIDDYIKAFHASINKLQEASSESKNSMLVFDKLTFFIRDLVENLEIELSYNWYTIKQPAHALKSADIIWSNSHNEYSILAKNMNLLIQRIHSCQNVLYEDLYVTETKEHEENQDVLRNVITPKNIFDILIDPKQNLDNVIIMAKIFNKPRNELESSPLNNNKYNMEKVELFRSTLKVIVLQ